MAAGLVRKKEESCHCDLIRKDVILPDGFQYSYYQCLKCNRVEYTPQQVQHLMDYSQNHLFIFISDWIFLWICTSNNSISWDTKTQKQMLLSLCKFTQENNISSEISGFNPYCTESYMNIINHNAASLIDIGMMELKRVNTHQENLFLTESGKIRGKEISNKLVPDLLEKFKEFRHNFQN